MSSDIRLPVIHGTTSEEKIHEISKYLFQLAEQLNFDLNDLENQIHSDIEKNASQNRQAIGKKRTSAVENYTITSGQWQPMTGATPFTAYADKTTTYSIKENTIVRLLNSNPIEQYETGLVIGQVINAHTIRFWTINQPLEDIEGVSVEFREVV